MHRRQFMLASAGFFLPLRGQAQQSDGVREMRGEVLVNGRPASRKTRISAGDEVETRAGGYLVFALGRDAFMLRENSRLRLERDAKDLLLTGLRLITGALGAVFGKRSASLNIVAPTVTAGIRGTGCYLETRAGGTYFCTCYGTIELGASANPRDRETLTATRHNNPRMIYAQPKDGQLFEPAPFVTHSDAEMEMLERAAGRKAPWVR
jgi:hypothetical protein